MKKFYPSKMQNSVAAIAAPEKNKSVFRYALELVLLFVLVFVTVSTFAQTRATAVTETDGPAKLEFVKQTAIYNSGKIYLNWVAQANSVDCIYVIERSSDGFEFEPVGLKEGIGAAIELLYSWVDTKPSVSNNNYYRIKQVNNNGNLMAQTEVQEVPLPENPLFIDKGSRMVMVK